MQTVSGVSNWKLVFRRDEAGVTILRAAACGKRAALPEEVLGLPVTALGDHALAAGPRNEPEGEKLLITCGPPEDGAEWDNRQLRELTLPEGLRSVGDYAFLNCAELKVLRLHDGIRHWGGGALMNCRRLDTFHLARTSPGTTLAYLAGELSRELDVTVTEADGTAYRLLFPEFTELYEENCPAHHFDYFISGAGYPYHHCFRQKKLNLKEYDALWRDFLGMEYNEASALRIAWYRLRWPVELGDAAASDYRKYLQAHAGEALRLLLADADSLPYLLEQCQPDREALAGACALARERGAASALAVLLEEQHRRFPMGDTKRFEL